MADPFYPQLQEAGLLQLRVVLEQMAQHPGYLTHDKCPYTPTTIAFLAKFADAGDETDVPALADEGERLDYVEHEVMKVLKDLDGIVRGLATADHSEKLQVQKARAQLVEKLVTFREKIWNMKSMSDFQIRILGFLEEACTKDQILILKERLRDLKSVEGEAA